MRRRTSSTGRFTRDIWSGIRRVGGRLWHHAFASRIRISTVSALCLLTPLVVAGRAGDAVRERRTLTGRRALVIAHRGGAGPAGENTIGAFRHALRGGADGIETDLRLTRDGRIVLCHGARVSQPQNGGLDLSSLRTGLPVNREPGGFTTLVEKILAGLELLMGNSDDPLVSDLTYAELLAHRPIQTGRGKSAEPIPVLADLLDSISSGMLDMDIKAGPRVPELVDTLIVALKGFSDLNRVVVEVPDLAVAERLRAAFGPRIKLQVTPGLDFSEPYQASLERALRLKPHSISVPYRLVTAEVVDKAHQAGVEVWVWTVNSTQDARDVAVLGVDAIKTDNPSVLARTLSTISR